MLIDGESKPKQGRSKWVQNHSEEVLARSTRSREIKQSAKALSIKAGITKQAEADKEKERGADVKRQKEEWLR